MSDYMVWPRVRGFLTDSARRSTAWVFGTLAGLGGITHGIGEVLQGSVKPEGMVFNSWTQGPIAANMGGEPGMTVIPNLLVTGLLCIAVGLALVAWSVSLSRVKHGGVGLIVLSLALLLTGGGFGPPLIGVLAGVAGLHGSRNRVRGGSLRTRRMGEVLASSWPWLFAISGISGVLLVIGSIVLVYTINLNAPDFFVWNFFFTVATLILTVVAATAYDGNRQQGQRPARLVLDKAFR